MKLVGYIKKNKQNSFQIPVYAKWKGDYFFHSLDDRYNITEFIPAEFKDTSYKELYLSKKFAIGLKGAIVFVGNEDYIHYNAAPTAIDEIIHYVNDTCLNQNSNAILDEAMLIKNRVFSDQIRVDHFMLKMNPKNEEITLSFDFPSPQKETSQEGEKSVASIPEEKVKSSRKATLLEPTTAEYTDALQYFNSVDMNVEIKLKLRAEERRTKLKTFNYQFKLNQNSRKRQQSGE